jgi:hypothetical protein
VVTVQSSEILRAAQTFVSLVESLNRQDNVLPVVFTSSVERLQSEMPELMNDDHGFASVSDALEVVTNWLERVADRDPALFRSLMSKIQPKAKTTNNPVTENVESAT